jgi:hypothetical protein
MVKVKVTVTFFPAHAMQWEERYSTVPLIKKAIMNTTSNSTSEIIIINISFMQGIYTYIP